MPANFNTAVQENARPCLRPARDSFIKADSNCLGQGALGAHPRLAELLANASARVRANALNYEDSRRLDGKTQRLCQSLAVREKVSASQILPGGSGLERIPTLAGALGVRCILRLEGDFPGYDRHAFVHGAERRLIPVDPETHAISPEALAEAVRGVRNAMLCLTMETTNPLQSHIGRAHVAAAARANPELIILVDGAYRQFGDYFHYGRLAEEFDQVIYLQVASKDVFLPSARVSWVIPSARHAARLAEVQLPFPMNPTGLEQVLAILEEPDLLDALRSDQIIARDRLSWGLGRLGLPIIAGAGPWVLIKCPADASGLVHSLERRFGILVQQQLDLPPLGVNWIRISATTPHEVDQIILAMSVLIAERIAS